MIPSLCTLSCVYNSVYGLHYQQQLIGAPMLDRRSILHDLCTQGTDFLLLLASSVLRTALAKDLTAARQP